MKGQGRGNHFGFTLIEMLVVVGIIALLATIVGITAQGWILHGKQLGTKGQIDGLTLALAAYKTDLASYPPRDQMIEALEDGIRGNIRWNGPYYAFEKGKVGETDAQGNLKDPRNSPLTFIGGTPGDAERSLLPPDAHVYLDQFDRPIVYVPQRDYNNFGTIDPNETDFLRPGEPVYYNDSTVQVFSFGADGKSDQSYPGSLLYTDGIDNDGDGLIDRADNAKANSRLGRKDVEDDLANW